MLEFEQVSKGYRNGDEQVRAVDGLSLCVRAGEMLAIQGPSGSGKTTLLLMAACALRADAGVVRYDGQDLARLNARESAQYRLSEVGLIAQHTGLMAQVSAIENAATKLLLGGVPLGQARAVAMDWLERLGMGARAMRTPEQLSGGERQRVAIARALAGAPRLILADEPTGSLDTQRSQEIVALLGEIAREQQAAVLLVTHDPDAAAAADRRVLIRDGRFESEMTVESRA